MSLYGYQPDLSERENVGNIQGQRNAGTLEHTQNIRAGLPVATTKYGVSINDYDYLDLAVDFLRDVRHFGSSDYYAVVKSDNKGDVILPCNLHEIDALVSLRLGLDKYSDRLLYKTENESNPFSMSDEYLAQVGIVDELLYWPNQTSEKRNGDGFITYRFKNKRVINVKAPNIQMVIAYSGLTVDEEGFPYITRKQANGIAAVVWHRDVLLKANRGDKNAINMLQYTMAESGRLKQASAIPEDITDNEIDEILNAKTSFNRKNYRRPSKHTR